MNFIQAILMGIVQGLSEFLPISSSAHLVFTSNFYKVMQGLELTQETNQEVFFDIMLHFGTLVAVIIFFRKEIWEIIKALIDAIKTKQLSDLNAKWGVYIILGTVVTIIIGFLFNDLAEFFVYCPVGVGILLVITGIVLLFSEYKSKKITEKKEIDLKSSILISIAQGIAVLPGFSRSGWTIATALFSGIDRSTAARYSFLLSIPIILGASMVYPFLTIDMKEIVTYDWGAIIVGTIVSAIVGYFCIKYFLKLVAKFSLAIFGYYCIVVGGLAAVFFTMVK